MKNKLLLILSITILSSCSSDNDDTQACTKEIIVQNEFVIQSPSGTTVIPEIKQTVSCDVPDPEVATVITDLPSLTEFSYEVLDVTVISDTGNNTSKISYSIKLNNLSNVEVKGIPYVTTRINNDPFTSKSANTSSCLTLGANSSCTITFEAEEPLSTGMISTYSVEDVSYLLYQ